jgi:hypothetical protein
MAKTQAYYTKEQITAIKSLWYRTWGGSD